MQVDVRYVGWRGLGHREEGKNVSCLVSGCGCLDTALVGWVVAVGGAGTLRDLCITRLGNKMDDVSWEMLVCIWGPASESSAARPRVADGGRYHNCPGHRGR